MRRRYSHDPPGSFRETKVFGFRGELTAGAPSGASVKEAPEQPTLNTHHPPLNDQLRTATWQQEASLGTTVAAKATLPNCGEPLTALGVTAGRAPAALACRWCNDHWTVTLSQGMTQLDC